jgi:hypothetical protein
MLPFHPFTPSPDSIQKPTVVRVKNHSTHVSRSINQIPCKIAAEAFHYLIDKIISYSTATSGQYFHQVVIQVDEVLSKTLILLTHDDMNNRSHHRDGSALEFGY